MWRHWQVRMIQGQSARRETGRRRTGPAVRTRAWSAQSAHLTLADVSHLFQGLALLVSGVESLLALGAAPEDTVGQHAIVPAPGPLRTRLARQQEALAAQAATLPARLAATRMQAQSLVQQTVMVAREQAGAVTAVGHRLQHGGARRPIVLGLLGGGLGALLVSLLRTRVWTLVRSGGIRTAGHLQQARQHIVQDRTEIDDATLVDRVQSVIFRDPAVPKGHLSINAEQGRVVLRGAVDEPAQINAVDVAVRRVPGVREVENLLHLPDTPAPQS